MELPSREGSGHLLHQREGSEHDFDTIPLPEAPVLFRWPSLDRSDEEEQRNATWIELFYDLVFVVCVARLGTIPTLTLVQTSHSTLPCIPRGRFEFA